MSGCRYAQLYVQLHICPAVEKLEMQVRTAAETYLCTVVRLHAYTAFPLDVCTAVKIHVRTVVKIVTTHLNTDVTLHI